MKIIHIEDDGAGEFDHKTVTRMNLVVLKYLRHRATFADAMAIAFDEIVAPELPE